MSNWDKQRTIQVEAVSPDGEVIQSVVGQTMLVDTLGSFTDPDIALPWSTVYLRTEERHCERIQVPAGGVLILSAV